jgi:2-hydroxychromene-2-carboxylate isomerase
LQNLSFKRPNPFPQSSLLATRVALVGLDEGWGEQFVRCVYRAEFGDGCTISEPASIAELVASLGVDPGPALARGQSEVIKARLHRETEEARRLGIFGAPSFVAGGELFWGNDRLEQAIAWTKGSTS